MPHEDGTTNDHLDFLRSRLPQDRVQLVRPPEGGRWNPNVDFEIWLLDKQRQIVGLRLQAKRIDETLTKYADLEKPKARLQAMRVIENRFRSAKSHRRKGAKDVYRYPLYCLYTATADATVGFGNPGWARSYGCSLIAAPTLLSSIQGGTAELSALAKHLLPWAWPFTSRSLTEIESRLQQGLFGGIEGGRGPSKMHDPSSDPSDEELVEQLGKGDLAEREAAAQVLKDARPPGGKGRVSLKDAPAYVRGMAMRMEVAGVDLAWAEDSDASPEGVDFSVLVRL